MHVCRPGIAHQVNYLRKNNNRIVIMLSGDEKKMTATSDNKIQLNAATNSQSGHTCHAWALDMHEHYIIKQNKGH